MKCLLQMITTTNGGKAIVVLNGTKTLPAQVEEGKDYFGELGV